MPTLDEIQRTLSQWLQRPRTVLGDPDLARAIAIHLTGNERLSPGEQLEIYREQYWLRHTSSLVEDFPGLSGILGQQDWERLVEGYLVAHPPFHFSLRDLGAQLPTYVEQQRWLTPHQLCIDMARLEWAYIECFDAADSILLDPAKISQIGPDAWASSRLSIAPALRLLHVTYPVAELRRALKESGPSSTIAYPEASPEHLVIYRERGGLRHIAVNSRAFELLGCFQRGMPLLEGVEHLLVSGLVDEEALTHELADWFQDWAARGWVCDVVSEPCNG